MMPCPPEMQMCRRCGKELSYTKQAYAFEDKDHVCDGCKPIESKTTKKKKPKITGKLTSVQFDKNGLPIYIFTEDGIYHVEFRKMKRHVE